MILNKIEPDNNCSLYITVKNIRDMIFDDWTGILRKQCDRTYQRKRLTD